MLFLKDKMNLKSDLVKLKIKGWAISYQAYVSNQKARITALMPDNAGITAFSGKRKAICSDKEGDPHNDLITTIIYAPKGIALILVKPI